MPKYVVLCLRQRVSVPGSHPQGAWRESSEAGKEDGPWFPDKYGRFCTKEGVVETIRRAVCESGGVAKAKDSSEMWIISGHTFRITGARTLSA